MTAPTRPPSPAAAACAPPPAPPHVLREYALLADGERGAVIGPRGELSWLCFPGWDGDVVFASLLGGGGSYAIRPAGRFVWGGAYEPGGLVWRSRWVTEDAIVECREALALPARPDRAVILRRVVAVAGTAQVEVTLDLRAQFGTVAPSGLRRDDGGVWRGRAGDVAFAWTGAGTARVDGATGTLSLAPALSEGTVHDLVLVLGARLPTGPRIRTRCGVRRMRRGPSGCRRGSNVPPERATPAMPARCCRD